MPKKLALVGQSFGSEISAAAVAIEPTFYDGLVLTGFSYNTTASNSIGSLEALQPRIAALQQPTKWCKLDSAYLVPADIYSYVNTFYKRPDYELDVVEKADMHEQPFSIMELLSVPILNVSPTAFTGAAMVIAGQHDFIYCTGNCDDVIEHAAAEVFQKAKVFKAISYPGSGHALNLAANATGAYKEIFTFLKTNGL